VGPAWIVAGLCGFLAAQAEAPCAAAEGCIAADQHLSLATPGELTMSTNATLPPMQYVDASGNLMGMNIDLGNEIARRLCLKARFINVQFEAEIPGLRNRRWDMIDTGLYFTVDRARVMQLIPYSVGALAVITNAGNPHGFKSLQDLSGAVVGVELGGIEERRAREISSDLTKAGSKPSDIRVFNSYSDAFQALAATQIDAVLAGAVIGNYYAKRGQFEVPLGQVMSQAPAALATSDPAIAAAVVAALASMAADGTYQRIINQYGMTTIDKWDGYRGKIQYFYTP
jgi:polar amino acid transport system substrate-binding protein